MQRIGVAILIAVAIFATVSYPAATASADESAPQPLTGKRQMADCMTRRMAASRSLSYNGAAKLCKDLLAAQKLNSASNVAQKPTTSNRAQGM